MDRLNRMLAQGMGGMGGAPPGTVSGLCVSGHGPGSNQRTDCRRTYQLLAIAALASKNWSSTLLDGAWAAHLSLSLSHNRHHRHYHRLSHIVLDHH